MQNVSIDITRQYIYEYVTTLTGALGRQKEAYDKFVCLPDNYAVLDRFMDTAIAVVEASMWRKLQDTHNFTLQFHKENLTITVNNPAFPERLHGALCTNVRLALAYLLAGMWLQGIDAELYTHYAEIADKYINSASVIALQKDFSELDYKNGLGDSEAIPTDGQLTTATRPKKDDTPCAAAGLGQGVGDEPLDDCHINKHSRFDHATFWPDGTVARF